MVAGRAVVVIFKSVIQPSTGVVRGRGPGKNKLILRRQRGGGYGESVLSLAQSGLAGTVRPHYNTRKRCHAHIGRAE